MINLSFNDVKLIEVHVQYHVALVIALKKMKHNWF